MGLADIVQNMAQAAFNIIGDIPKACTYTSKGTPTYNPATGAYTSTDTTYSGLKFLFEDYAVMEIDDQNILSTDMKATIPQLNLTPTPKKQDTITDADSVAWDVVGIGKDPADALWVFQVRKP